MSLVVDPAMSIHCGFVYCHQTLAKLEKFKSKLQQTTVGGKVPAEDKSADDAPGDDWLSHQLKFEVDPTKKVHVLCLQLLVLDDISVFTVDLT